jgi:hypothetical protein
MRQGKFLAAILLFIIVQVSVGRQSGFVSSRGKEIVSPEGKSILLRGVNLGNWLVPEGYMFQFKSATSPSKINDVMCELIGADEAGAFWKKYRDAYITRADIQYIKKLGLNSIRVPFSWRLFTIEEYPELWTGPGFEMLDRVIEWCREANLWVILDMHCAPGGQTGDNIDDSRGYPFIFENPGSQERTIQLWRKIADRYKNERIVIGYDLLNEPIAHFFDQKKLNPLLEPLYKRITAAVREVDTNHLIFLGGAQWDGNFAVFGLPFDAKSVYTFHKYWCDTTQEMVQEYVTYREKYSVPIWMGESGENTDAWISAWRQLLERNAIGWCFWPYKKMDSPRCIVTFDRPADWKTIERYANGPRATFQDIRAARPDIVKVQKAMEEFLSLCNFEHCRLNKGYAAALGVPEKQ